MLGSLGEIEFEVSENSIKTFQDLSFTHQANYSEHKIINRKSLLEFTGLSASSCSLKIILDVNRGNIPKRELEILRGYLANHEAIAFILGGDVQGGGLWVIESLNENLEIIGAGGEIFRASVSVSLKEYLE